MKAKVKATVVRDGGSIRFFREGEKPVVQRKKVYRWGGTWLEWIRPTRGAPRRADYAFCGQGIKTFGLGALRKLPNKTPVEVMITIEGA